MTIGRTQFDRRTLVYGFAHFGKSLLWYASEILFAYYLSEVCGLAPRSMGLVLAAGFVVGAVADICVGRFLGHLLNAAGSAARLQMIGGLLGAGTLSAIFVDAFLPVPQRLAFAIVTGLAFRIAYACYDLPQNALLSLGTADADGRSRVAAMRIFFSGTASFLVATATAALLTADISLGKPARFLIAAGLWSLVAVISAGLLSRLRWPSVVVNTQPDESSAAPARVPGLVWLLVAAFIISATASSFGKIAPYYASYVLRSAQWGGAILGAMSVGSALSQPLWAWMALRLSRRTLFVSCTLTLAVAASVFWWVCRIPVPAMVAAAAVGAGGGGFGMALWAAYGDAVRRTPAINTGLAFGLLTAVIKIALAAGVLLIGEALSHFAYRGPQSGYLMALMCLVPAAGSLVILVVTLWPARRGRQIDMGA